MQLFSIFPGVSRVVVIIIISITSLLATRILNQTYSDYYDVAASFEAPHLQEQQRGKPNNNGATVGERQYLSLEELTGNPPEGSIHCAPPSLPVYDRIVAPSTVNGTGDIPHRKIPRTIHVSMKSRCLMPDLFDNMNKWKNSLPHHSYYFHDDDAMERLLDMKWEEFPHLKSSMRCVGFKGASRMDVWRILVIYKYGGLHSDSDVFPMEGFTENSPISPDDQAFFSSDASNMPSHSFFAMEPRHPIAYLTMFEILRQLQRVESIEDTLKQGYRDALGGDNFKEGTHECKNIYGSWTVTKRSQKNSFVQKIDMEEIVAWNATLNVTRRQKNEWRLGDGVDQKDPKTIEYEGSCLEYFYSLDVMA